MNPSHLVSFIAGMFAVSTTICAIDAFLGHHKLDFLLHLVLTVACGALSCFLAYRERVPEK